MENEFVIYNKVLRDSRINQGLSQTELAKMIGASQSQINRLEAGDRSLSRKWAVRLAGPLKVSVESLMFGTYEERSENLNIENSGARLKIARKKAGFKSAGKAADALGITHSTYRAHENGQNAFDTEDAKHYAELFDVSLYWLITGGEKPKLPEICIDAQILNHVLQLTDDEKRRVYKVIKSAFPL